MKKVILFLILFLMAIWTSETMAQQPIQPIYDPFFEMFTSTVEAGRRKLTTDGKGLTFEDHRHLLPSYRLDIFVYIYPASAYSVPGVSVELITIGAVIDDGANQQTFFIRADGTGTGKKWMERKWEYRFIKVTSDSEETMVSEEVAKEAAKKFLDFWHGRSSIAPKDIPEIFY